MAAADETDRESGEPPAPGFGPEQWQAFREQIGAGGHPQQCLDLCPICRAADVLRAGGRPEMRHGLGELQREALMTARALIDHYLERIDAEPEAGGGAVEKIPID